MCCWLKKSLYGLKQAPRAWFQRFATYACSLDFIASKSDASLFVLHRDSTSAYLLLYVDDIILTASSSVALTKIITQLSTEFSMKDLGPLHHFLGISVHRTPTTLHLSQRQYILEVLSRAGMTNCNPSSTPIALKRNFLLRLVLLFLILLITVVLLGLSNILH